MKNIKVSGIESKENRIMLLEDIGKQYPVRYSFFQTWQGKNTDVYDQFLSLGVSIGKNYDIEVVEKPGKNAGGKDVVYRNITKFYDAPQKTPKFEPTSQNNQQNTSMYDSSSKTLPGANLVPKTTLEELESKIRTAFKTRDEKIDFLMTENKIMKENLSALKLALTPDQKTIYDFHSGEKETLNDLGCAVEVPEDFLRK